MEIVHQTSTISSFLGIDIAKDSLVVHLLEADGAGARKKKFANTDEGVQRLIDWLGSRAETCRAVIEATSRYHRICERGLLNAQVRVDLLNPRKARSLAIGLGIADKDDSVDAKVLAKAAQILELRDEKVHSLKAQDLRDHSRVIDTLKKDGANHLKRMDGLIPGSRAYQALDKAVRTIKKLIAEEERLWLIDVKQEEEIYRRYTLAKSIPDVGFNTARIASVELPADLDTKSLRQLVAYAGVVPRRNQSGNRELRASIDGGNAHLRTGVFMAAMHSVFKGKRHMPFYDEIHSRAKYSTKTKGASHLVAIVAVMHKILRNIIAVIKRNSPWTTEPPEPAILCCSTS